MRKSHLHHESNQQQEDQLGSKRKPKFKKKKIGFFYKINFFLLLIVSIVLAYFVILVSTKPKSIPFVTAEIKSVLQKNFGDDASLNRSYVSFTRYGTLKISITDLRIFYKLAAASEKQVFIIPKLESEFSLFNLLLLRFHPSKIKIINPTIALDELQKFQQESKAYSSQKTSDVSALIKLLASIRSGEIPIEHFEIENAKLLIRGQEFDTEILLKKSQIRTSLQKKILHISSINRLSFDAEKADVDLNSNCQLFEQDGLKCDLVLENFVANSVADLHPSLSALNQINAMLSAAASFTIKNGEMSNFLFKAAAQKGDFEFPDFFSQKINFSDFSLAGAFDGKLGILNLSEIKTDFIDAASDQANQAPKPHLEMSLLISDLKNLRSKKLDFLIKLRDAPGDQIEKFWPSALQGEGVRQWVLEHVSGGLVKNGFAKFSLIKSEAGSQLQSMDAQVAFAGLNLEYSENFPAISNLAGSANFGITGMKIAIAEGEVLNSKISESLVAIDDFSAPIAMLKISGKSQGHAADGLMHVDHKSKFAEEIGKYLNGNSQNEFDIRIPLAGEIDLKSTYIAVNSAISGLANPYGRGDLTISSKKDFGSVNFITSVDLTAAELTAKAFDIEKKSNVKAGIDLIVAVQDEQKISLKNIALWKQEEVKSKKITSKISGEINFETAPFLISSLDLKNENFGKNNYSLAYSTNKKTASEKIFIKGKQLNLAALLKGNFYQNSLGGKTFPNSQIQVAIDNLSLLRNKAMKNFYLSLACNNSFCYRGLAKGDYGKKQLLNLRADKKSAEKFSTIEGEILDVGYLAEALGLSNVISGGLAKLKLRNELIDKKPILAGEIKIDDNITIYDNPALKRLASNSLFSKVRDKVFASDKTIFNSVKLNFSITGKILNIESLIANNYKIGITAKGVVNLGDDTYSIKGMIVPGFIINNLFGIGKIPLIGNVISGLLTGGEGGGLFGIRYQYVKKKGDKEAVFETNKISSFVPTTIKNLFDLI